MIEVNYIDPIERGMAYSAANAVDPEFCRDTIDKYIAEVYHHRATLADIAPDIIISPRATQRGAGLLAKGWTFDRVVTSVLRFNLTPDQIAKL